MYVHVSVPQVPRPAHPAPETIRLRGSVAVQSKHATAGTRDHESRRDRHYPPARAGSSNRVRSRRRAVHRTSFLRLRSGEGCSLPAHRTFRSETRLHRAEPPGVLRSRRPRDLAFGVHSLCLGALLRKLDRLRHAARDPGSRRQSSRPEMPHAAANEIDGGMELHVRGSGDPSRLVAFDRVGHREARCLTAALFFEGEANGDTSSESNRCYERWIRKTRRP